MKKTYFLRTLAAGRAKHWLLVTCCAALAVPAVASAAEGGGSQGARSAGPSTTVAKKKDSPYLSDWYNQHLSLIGSSGIRFGPTHVDDIYLEYEFAGTKGPFDLYGYVDAHKILGVGNNNDTGFWDGGSPLFAELEPRMSFNRLLDTDLSVGPIKEWFLATDYILDVGNDRGSRQNTLYFGPGVSFDTHSPINFELNFFFRRQFANYGAENSFSWDGYRIQPNVSIPITTITTNGSKGDLLYVGFANYDFGSDLGDKAGPTRTNSAFVATNVFILSYTHLRYFFAARYFNNGGQWNDGTRVYFPNGSRHLDQNGWGYYLAVGWKF